MKKAAFQDKWVGVLRMAFVARKDFETFENGPLARSRLMTIYFGKISFRLCGKAGWQLRPGSRQAGA